MLLAYRLQNFPANENEGPVPEEIYQTLLFPIKPGNEDKVQASTLLTQPCFAYIVNFF